MPVAGRVLLHHEQRVTASYIVEAHAESELSEAVEAVRHRKRFASKGLSDHNRSDATDTKALGRFFQEEVLPPLIP